MGDTALGQRTRRETARIGDAPARCAGHTPTGIERCLTVCGIPMDSGEDRTMRIVVIGGTGLVGSKLVAKLRDQGHDAIAAAPPNVNTITGQGLAAALSGAD